MMKVLTVVVSLLLVVGGASAFTLPTSIVDRTVANAYRRNGGGDGGFRDTDPGYINRGQFMGSDRNYNRGPTWGGNTVNQQRFSAWDGESGPYERFNVANNNIGRTGRGGGRYGQYGNSRAYSGEGDRFFSPTGRGRYGGERGGRRGGYEPMDSPGPRRGRHGGGGRRGGGYEPVGSGSTRSTYDGYRRNNRYDRGNFQGSPGSCYIEGNHRRTLSSPYEADGAQVWLQTDGRPMEAILEFYQGPHCPTKMKVYSEDGSLLPLCASVETPGYEERVISIANTGMALPIHAGVAATGPLKRYVDAVEHDGEYMYSELQGKSLKTWALDGSIRSARISLESDGMPIMCTVQVWGVRDHVSQVVEIYNEDGNLRPVELLLELPGDANTIAIRNVGSVSFPMRASVEPSGEHHPRPRRSRRGGGVRRQGPM